MEPASQKETQSDSVAGLKAPKVPKASRYYYRHREEILERRRARLSADPEYVAKQKAREESKRAREEAKRAREAAAKKAREEAKAKAREEAKKACEEAKKETQEERRARMARLLGLEPPGQN